MYKLKGIKKSFNDKLILNDVNLEVEDGTIVSILGINGAGKTTLFKIIAGILFCDEGSIILNDIDFKDNLILYKKNIGYLPDNYDSFLNLTGYEYLNFIADIYKISQYERNSKIKKLSEMLSLNNHLDSLISTYSKGMKQKIKFIGSLLHDPKVWILDEPFNGLDLEAVLNVKSILRDLSNKGSIIIFSTHILEVALNISDRIFVLNNGILEETYNIDQKDQELFEKKFLEITKRGN